MKKWIAGLGLALVMLCPATARAQFTMAWDAPSFMSPVLHNDLGIYFLKPQNTDWGFAGTWASGESRGLNLGVRGQYVQISSGSTQWGIGAFAKGGVGPVAPPLLINWTLGVGTQTGAGVTTFRVPLGVSLGARLASPGLVLVPYVQPRVSFAHFSYDDPAFVSNNEFEFDTDLGVDLDLADSPLIIRVGGTIGSMPAFGAGLAFKLGHRY